MNCILFRADRVTLTIWGKKKDEDRKGKDSIFSISAQSLDSQNFGELRWTTLKE